MTWSEVFEPGIDTRTLFLERLPAMQRTRQEEYRAFSSATIVLSVLFEDAGERFTLTFDPEGMEAIDEEAIDFPVASARGSLKDWERALPWIQELVVPADAQVAHYRGKVHLSQATIERFERFDGIFVIEISDLPDGRPLSFEVVLNDYEAPADARRVRVSVAWSLLQDVAHGRVDPVSAARRLKLGGDIGLALEIGGFLMSELGL
ncbi:hypothetical protein DL240_05395 [Lujinxingia litoralis]|uniref:SCP2 domain-containing protein n=1 Tax=Lujinxingia litoralis TaxID=2211119 RepID=A0A328C6M8_9DELT|nr:SCP2 sterol-binding domain-containing protein [Lujinxingia litoralis]RAL23595.1 hypothetical protein DL240_05395 [Lujinxingia litoralis]